MQHLQQNLLNSYHELVNYRGKNVYMHLVDTFVLRLYDDVDEELENIPHPYREYVAKGQRMVIDHIRAAASLAEESDYTEEEVPPTPTVTEQGV